MAKEQYVLGIFQQSKNGKWAVIEEDTGDILDTFDTPKDALAYTKTLPTEYKLKNETITLQVIPKVYPHNKQAKQFIKTLNNSKTKMHFKKNTTKNIFKKPKVK